MCIITDALIAVQQGNVIVQVGWVVGGVEADGTDAHDLERLGLIVDSQLPLAGLHLQVVGVHTE